MLGNSVWRLFPLSLVSCQPHTAGVCYSLQRQVQTISHMSPNSETSIFPVRACKAKSLQSRPTLCNPLDPPGSSVFGILQARILEWVATPFSRGSSQPRDWTQSPALQVGSLPSEPSMLKESSKSRWAGSEPPPSVSWTKLNKSFPLCFLL